MAQPDPYAVQRASRPSAFSESLSEFMQSLGGRIAASPAERQQALVERQAAMEESMMAQPATSAAQGMARLIFAKALKNLGYSDQDIETTMPNLMSNLTRGDIATLEKLMPIVGEPRPQPREPLGASPAVRRGQRWLSAVNSGNQQVKMAFPGEAISPNVAKGFHVAAFVRANEAGGSSDNLAPLTSNIYHQFQALEGSQPGASIYAAQELLRPETWAQNQQEFGEEWPWISDLARSVLEPQMQKRGLPWLLGRGAQAKGL